jgi:hypothetical protein
LFEKSTTKSPRACHVLPIDHATIDYTSYSWWSWYGA